MRQDAPDRVWHITGRVNWQVWHLRNQAAFDLYCEKLEEAREKFGVTLLSNVGMSNHYHFVAQSPDEDRFRSLTWRCTAGRHFRPYPRSHLKSSVIGQFMRYWKLAVSRGLQKSLGLKGRFWEGRHHRRRIEDAWALVTAVAYDHRNPVRAGMVLTPEQYERSSAAWWVHGTSEIVQLCTRPDFPFLERAAFRERLLSFQQEKRLDDVMEAFAKSRWPIDSARGRELLEELMEEAGLDPLGAPSMSQSAAVRR